MWGGLRATERRLDDLRAADREATTLALAHLERELDTFLTTYRADRREDEASRRALAAAIADERGTFISEESYAQRHNVLLGRMDGVERWQYKIVGALVLATFVAPVLSATFVWYITH